MDMLEDEGFLPMINNVVTPIYDVILGTQTAANWDDEYGNAHDIYTPSDFNQNSSIMYNVTANFTELLGNVTSTAPTHGKRSYYKVSVYHTLCK